MVHRFLYELCCAPIENNIVRCTGGHWTCLLVCRGAEVAKLLFAFLQLVTDFSSSFFLLFFWQALNFAIVFHSGPPSDWKTFNRILMWRPHNLVDKMAGKFSFQKEALVFLKQMKFRRKRPRHSLFLKAEQPHKQRWE